MKVQLNPGRFHSGMTLVELMVVIAVMGLVMLSLMGISMSASRLHGRTSRLAGVQMSAREGLSLMETELRQAGADPGDPQIGLVGLVSAQAQLIRVRADLNGDGVLQTTEPSEDVTYSYDAASRSILRNPGSGAQVVMPNVSAMTLTYFDGANATLTPLPLNATNAARVRAVGVTITAQDRDSLSITLNTRIALRNME
jgi:prepilin-type N-terminal cleavage/methylation domain-containing protein